MMDDSLLNYTVILIKIWSVWVCFVVNYITRQLKALYSQTKQTFFTETNGILFQCDVPMYNTKIYIYSMYEVFTWFVYLP